MIEITATCLSQTQSIASKLADDLAKQIGNATLMLFLQGEQGAGKTAFCRSFIHTLCGEVLVKSPTYELLNIYKGSDGLAINHADFYRILDPFELEAFDFYSCLTPRSITLIEWPKIVSTVLPAPDMLVEMEHVDKNTRKIRIQQQDNNNFSLQYKSYAK